MNYIVGVDVGGTGIRCGLLDEKFNIVATSSSVTPRTDIAAHLASMIKELCASNDISLAMLKGVGVAFPGFIDTVSGVIRSSSNLPYINLPLGSELSTLLGGVGVKLDNDGNLAALGEYTFGSGKNFDSALVLMIGTGIGGAFVDNGKVLDSELGHFTLVMGGKLCGCGLKGCAEAYSATPALLEKAIENELEITSGKELFKLIAEDNAKAKKALADYIPYLAATIVCLSSVYRPKTTILGGGITGSGELLLTPLREEINDQIKNCCYRDTIEIGRAHV